MLVVENFECRHAAMVTFRDGVVNDEKNFSNIQKIAAIENRFQIASLYHTVNVAVTQHCQRTLGNLASAPKTGIADTERWQDAVRAGASVTESSQQFLRSFWAFCVPKKEICYP